MSERIYVAIDLKSFYASVECVERGLDPMTTNLVVADLTRTEKTICLAVSPSLKSHGISGRARLFEVVQRVREVNRARKRAAPENKFRAKTFDATLLGQDPSLALEYIVAPPRMALYIDYSTRVYQIYLRFVAPEDIHVYSVDEVFIDATDYLRATGMTDREFVGSILCEVRRCTGLTATAGVGTNLYLSKVALDIEAKHIPPDENGARIARLDERSYREKLWDHRPITDFWRVGRGYAAKLEAHGLYTMGDVARCSIGKAGDFYTEELLYTLFGVNAELLIDHAWGWEPCTIADIRAYRPASNSLGAGQVLQTPYPHDKAALVLREMAESLALDLVSKDLVTDQIVLTVGYDAENATDGVEYTVDRYGRRIPRHAHGTENLGRRTSSARYIVQAASALFERIADKKLTVRRLNITATHVVPEGTPMPSAPEQMDLFTDYEEEARRRRAEEEELAREKRRQKAVLGIKDKYGKNAILKGMNLEEGATARSRNEQIGGHKA